ncbi:MAG TPA: hypothetical protein VIH35_04075, partial [Kiritimatiellia bacterium]
MKTYAAKIAALCLALGLAASRAPAEIYDVSTQFDPTSNPTANGTWTYGYATTLGGPLALYTNAVNTNEVDFWQAQLPPIIIVGPFDIEPLVLENQAATTTTGAYRSAILPSDQFALHPGPTGDLSVVRWTAPSNGPYAIAAIFTGLETLQPLL